MIATDVGAATSHLRDVLALPGIDSRTFLQAWHCLRALGVHPDDRVGGEVHGMVVEVGLDAGLDAVAAYKDRSARYFNHSGAQVVWDTETAAMNAQIDPFLEIARVIADNTKPFEEAHPSPPARGVVLINILTPKGIHIGIGETSALQNEPLGAAALQTAFTLMQELMGTAKSS